MFETDNIEKKFMERERKGERKNKETRRRCSKLKWCILKKKKTDIGEREKKMKDTGGQRKKEKKR